MLQRGFYIVIFSLILFVICMGQGKYLGKPLFQKSAPTVDVKQLEDRAKELYPNFASLQKNEKDIYEILDEKGQKIGNIIMTSPYADSISGFGDKVPLMIHVENDLITKIDMLKNSETPEYAKKVVQADYLNTWNGLNLEQAQNLEVDAVSGATFTSSAVRDSLKLRLGMALGQENQTIKVNKSIIIKNYIIFTMLIVALIAFFKQYKTLRLAVLVTSVLILGIWQGSMLSVTSVAGWLINGLPIQTQWAIFIVFLTAILLPLFTKKTFYCYYLCPFGAAQEIIGLKGKNIRINKKVLNVLSYGRTTILLCAMITLILSSVTGVTNLEPFSAFNPKSAPIAAIVIAVVSLILSFFIKRPFCKFACPCGALLDLPKKLRK